MRVQQISLVLSGGLHLAFVQVAGVQTGADPTASAGRPGH